jgi:hypothetical protein
MNTLITLINENGTWRKQVENAATCDQNDHMAHIRLKLMMRWENKLLKEEEERKTKEVSCDAPTLEYVGVSQLFKRVFQQCMYAIPKSPSMSLCQWPPTTQPFSNTTPLPRFYSYHIFWPSILRIFFEQKEFIKTTVSNFFGRSRMMSYLKERLLIDFFFLMKITFFYYQYVLDWAYKSNSMSSSA